MRLDSYFYRRAYRRGRARWDSPDHGPSWAELPESHEPGRALDLGCGGGLLAEPMARLGFAVNGADASEKNVKIATTHAGIEGLTIEYRAATAELLAEEGLGVDVVLGGLEECVRSAVPGRILLDETLWADP